MKQPVPISTNLPDDLRDMLAERSRTKGKKTVVELNGGRLEVGQAMETLAPVFKESGDILRHLERWSRFEARWKHHKTIGAWAVDMRVWEGRKAGVNLAKYGQWFYGVHPIKRMELVQEAIERKMSERRLKLARKKLRLLSMPTSYIDENFGLRAG